MIEELFDTPYKVIALEQENKWWINQEKKVIKYEWLWRFTFLEKNQSLQEIQNIIWINYWIRNLYIKKEVWLEKTNLIEIDGQEYSILNIYKVHDFSGVHHQKLILTEKQ